MTIYLFTLELIRFSDKSKDYMLKGSTFDPLVQPLIRALLFPKITWCISYIMIIYRMD